MDLPQTIKVYFGSEIRRWHWTVELYDLSALRSRIERAFPARLSGTVWSLKWKDEDGDLITITETEDMIVAVHSCANCTLRIFVTVVVEKSEDNRYGSGRQRFRHRGQSNDPHLCVNVPCHGPRGGWVRFANAKGGKSCPYRLAAQHVGNKTAEDTAAPAASSCDNRRNCTHDRGDCFPGSRKRMERRCAGMSANPSAPARPRKQRGGAEMGQTCGDALMPWVPVLQGFVRDTLGVNNVDVDVLVDHPLLKAVFACKQEEEKEEKEGKEDRAASTHEPLSHHSQDQSPCSATSSASSSCVTAQSHPDVVDANSHAPVPAPHGPPSYSAHARLARNVVSKAIAGDGDSHGEEKTTAAHTCTNNHVDADIGDNDKYDTRFEDDAVTPTRRGDDDAERATVEHFDADGQSHGFSAVNDDENDDDDDDDDDDGDDGDDDGFEVVEAVGVPSQEADVKRATRQRGRSALDEGEPTSSHSSSSSHSSHASSTKARRDEATDFGDVFGPFTAQVVQLLKMGFDTDPLRLKAMLERQNGSVNAVITELISPRHD